MEPHPPADWFEFWVRFVFGALFGSLASLALCGDTSPAQAWPVILTGAMITGVAAGRFGDRFWYSLRSWFW